MADKLFDRPHLLFLPAKKYKVALLGQKGLSGRSLYSCVRSEW
jgi:hypothetical protein